MKHSTASTSFIATTRDALTIAAQFVLDASVVKVARYLQARLRENRDDRRTVLEEIWDRATKSSADYIEPKLNSALLFWKREQLWSFILGRLRSDGICAEFGVFSGQSINFFARSLRSEGRQIYGFDSFEGLQEDWGGTDKPKGAFDVHGILPRVEDNVTLVKGWFDQTIPPFLAEHGGVFSFIHLDADTYDSTAAVLEMISTRISKDTIIVFDEYLGIPNWRNGEFRAWREFTERHQVRYEYLGFSCSQTATQAAIRIL